MGEKYLCKNLGVKEGGGRLLEGGIFSGAYGIGTLVALVAHFVEVCCQVFVGQVTYELANPCKAKW